MLGAVTRELLDRVPCGGKASVPRAAAALWFMVPRVGQIRRERIWTRGARPAGRGARIRRAIEPTRDRSHQILSGTQGSRACLHSITCIACPRPKPISIGLYPVSPRDNIGTASRLTNISLSPPTLTRDTYPVPHGGRLWHRWSGWTGISKTAHRRSLAHEQQFARHNPIRRPWRSSPPWLEAATTL